MKATLFYKLQASGNDFILLDRRQKSEDRSQSYREFARTHCRRKLGIGADGVLVIERSKRAHFKMRIFNADGSEAEMCGNGARCVAVWARMNLKHMQEPVIRFETVAGIIEANVPNSRMPRIRATDPGEFAFNVPLEMGGRTIHVDCVNTGVPHAVIFVQGLEDIDVEGIGRAIRSHERFAPQGTNVNFVEVINRNSLKVRTYERGVEAETLACGTGAIAAAVIASFKLKAGGTPKTMRYSVVPSGGQMLKVYFRRQANTVGDVWLEGPATLVYTGKIL